MTTQPVTIIGTRMSPAAIEDYWGFMPPSYNNQISDVLREVCVERKYFTKTDAKRIKFYRFVEVDFEHLADTNVFLLDILVKAKKWEPDLAIEYTDYKNTEAKVNATYPYGEMTDETRRKYVSDMSTALGEKFIRIELPE